MSALISPAALNAALGKPDCLIFDTRFSLADTGAGELAYRSGHIPGAYYADLNRDLSNPPLPGRSGRHPLPERQTWLGRVRDWGIHPSINVVVYDDAGGAMAARLWWLLRWVGHERVSLLDGGWQAWQQAGFPLSQDLPAPRRPSDFDYRRLASLTRQVDAGGIEKGDYLLLDAREPARYRGEVEPIDPVAGHIPGALNLPFSANLDGEGKFKTETELRERIAALIGEDPGRDVVCYCGSGVTACHNILALILAGYSEPMLYPGSWSEWINDSDREVVCGD